MLSSKELEVTSLKKRNRVVKRVFDIFFSFFLLLLCFVPILFLVFLSTIKTKQFGVFKQKRVGFRGLIFTIYKIRTISKNRTISRFGKCLRRIKLDELPQLFNILIGDMSFVGPRPDLIGFADELKGSDRVILSVKPGLTGPATLKFIDEEEELLKASNPEKLIDLFWKEKVEINKEYVLNYYLCKDIFYIYKTILYAFKNMVV